MCTVAENNLGIFLQLLKKNDWARLIIIIII